MKIFSVLLVLVVAVMLLTLSSRESSEEHINDWAKETLALFQDTADFLASFKLDSSDEDAIEASHNIDQELESLLPQESLSLKFDPDLNDSLIPSNGEAVDVSPSALLPNLFILQKENGTSVKGQVFTDEKDKIIGAELQLAIPTDM